MYLPNILELALGGLGLCLVSQTHPTSPASHWVRMPQVKRLP